MASPKLLFLWAEYFVKSMYCLAVYMVILEIFYPFTFLDPESYLTVSLLLQTEYISWVLEVWARYAGIFVYIGSSTLKWVRILHNELYLELEPEFRHQRKIGAWKEQMKSLIMRPDVDDAPISPHLTWGFWILVLGITINSSVFNRIPILDTLLLFIILAAIRTLLICLWLIVALVFFIPRRRNIRAPCDIETAIPTQPSEDNLEFKSLSVLFDADSVEKKRDAGGKGEGR